MVKPFNPIWMLLGVAWFLTIHTVSAISRLDIPGMPFRTPAEVDSENRAIIRDLIGFDIAEPTDVVQQFGSHLLLEATTLVGDIGRIGTDAIEAVFAGGKADAINIKEAVTTVFTTAIGLQSMAIADAQSQFQQRTAEVRQFFVQFGENIRQQGFSPFSA